MLRFSFVFPNTAMVTATQAIGKSFNSNAIKIIGTVMTCLLILVYFFVVFKMVRGFMLRRLLWPEKSALRPQETEDERLKNTVEGAQRELQKLQDEGTV